MKLSKRFKVGVFYYVVMLSLEQQNLMFYFGHNLSLLN